jgi:hypothetical protein
MEGNMSRLSRRRFLGKSAVGLAGLGLSLARPRLALANPAWADLPAGIWPPGFQGYKILEIHLFGGTAPFESFYYRDAANLRTRGFDTEIQNLNWNGACANAPTGLELQEFSTDSNDKELHLGPFSKPLWRQDLRRRMRVIVQRHNLMPHEAAIPFTQTGLRLGRPTFSSTGAAVQHRRNALDEEASVDRSLPHSYALLPENGGLGSLFTLVQQVQGSFGMHPGSARPLVLRIGTGLGDFVSQLDRANLGSNKDALNALIDQYRGQYRDWLRFQSTSTLTRSNAFRDYDTAASRLLGADVLKDLLVDAPQTISPGPTCAREGADPFSNPDNPTRTALEFAAFLLTRPAEEAASSVFVLDSGLVRTDLPYDVHSFDHAGDTGSNLVNLLNSLVSVIKDPANPAPGDDSRIDLADTLIVINTEFGRTPFKSSGNSPNPGSLGRDHWPDAYVTTLIGGPIPDANDGTVHRVVGSISDAADEGAVADTPLYSATDMRAGLLVAAGVNPFAAENFALGQITASLVGVDHAATIENLRETLIGVS